MGFSAANGIENNALAALAGNAPRGVIGAIRDASVKTGVDFAYLVQQAKAESNFDPSVKARTSSATGLYQFINSTWLNVVDKYGAQHGIETEGKSKAEILELRKDPEIAANMAAEFAGENQRFLESRWGGEAGSTELYFAHFLGAPKAAAFLNARDSNPQQPAAVLFPKAAKANYNVFYESGTGRAKSVEEVYAFFDKKFDVKDLNPNHVAPDIAKDVAENIVQDTAVEDAAIAGVAHNPNSLFERATAQDAQRSIVFNRQPFASPIPSYQLVQSPVELMLLSQLDIPLSGWGDADISSLFGDSARRN